MSTDLTRDQKIAKQESELKQLQENQIADLENGTTEYITANRNSKYKVRKIESVDYVHIFTQIRHLDASGKNFINEDSVVIVHGREFDQRVKDGAFRTYDEVEVIHDGRNKGQGLDKRYSASELKPDQINVDGPVQKKVDDASGKATQLAKKEAKLNELAEDLEDTAKEQKARFERLAQSEKDLADREQALKDREAALAAKETANAANNTVTLEVTTGGPTAGPSESATASAANTSDNSTDTGGKQTGKESKK